MLAGYAGPRAASVVSFRSSGLPAKCKHFEIYSPTRAANQEVPGGFPDLP